MGVLYEMEDPEHAPDDERGDENSCDQAKVLCGCSLWGKTILLPLARPFVLPSLSIQKWCGFSSRARHRYVSSLVNQVFPYTIPCACICPIDPVEILDQSRIR